VGKRRPSVSQVAKGPDDEGSKQNSEEDQDVRDEVLEGELEHCYWSTVGRTPTLRPTHLEVMRSRTASATLMTRATIARIGSESTREKYRATRHEEVGGSHEPELPMPVDHISGESCSSRAFVGARSWPNGVTK
jgi:hypothetical protein